MFQVNNQNCSLKSLVEVYKLIAKFYKFTWWKKVQYGRPHWWCDVTWAYTINRISFSFGVIQAVKNLEVVLYKVCIP